MMVDTDVACVSPSSVYRILRDADPLSRRERSERKGTPPGTHGSGPGMASRCDSPGLVLPGTSADAYSQCVVHWDLLISIMAVAVRVVIHEAMRKTGANSEIVTDNRSQFTTKAR